MLSPGVVPQYKLSMPHYWQILSEKTLKEARAMQSYSHFFRSKDARVTGAPSCDEGKEREELELLFPQDTKEMVELQLWQKQQDKEAKAVLKKKELARETNARSERAALMKDIASEVPFLRKKDGTIQPICSESRAWLQHYVPEAIRRYDAVICHAMAMKNLEKSVNTDNYEKKLEQSASREELRRKASHTAIQLRREKFQEKKSELVAKLFHAQQRAAEAQYHRAKRYVDDIKQRMAAQCIHAAAVSAGRAKELADKQKREDAKLEKVRRKMEQEENAIAERGEQLRRSLDERVEQHKSMRFQAVTSPDESNKVFNVPQAYEAHRQAVQEKNEMLRVSRMQKLNTEEEDREKTSAQALQRKEARLHEKAEDATQNNELHRQRADRDVFARAAAMEEQKAKTAKKLAQAAKRREEFIAAVSEMRKYKAEADAEAVARSRVQLRACEEQRNEKINANFFSAPKIDVPQPSVEMRFTANSPRSGDSRSQTCSPSPHNDEKETLQERRLRKWEQYERDFDAQLVKQEQRNKLQMEVAERRAAEVAAIAQKARESQKQISVVDTVTAVSSRPICPQRPASERLSRRAQYSEQLRIESRSKAISGAIQREMRQKSEKMPNDPAAVTQHAALEISDRKRESVVSVPGAKPPKNTPSNQVTPRTFELSLQREAFAQERHDKNVRESEHRIHHSPEGFSLPEEVVQNSPTAEDGSQLEKKKQEVKKKIMDKYSHRKTIAQAPLFSKVEVKYPQPPQTAREARSTVRNYSAENVQRCAMLTTVKQRQALERHEAKLKREQRAGEHHTELVNSISQSSRERNEVEKAKCLAALSRPIANLSTEELRKEIDNARKRREDVFSERVASLGEKEVAKARECWARRQEHADDKEKKLIEKEESIASRYDVYL